MVDLINLGKVEARDIRLVKSQNLMTMIKNKYIMAKKNIMIQIT